MGISGVTLTGEDVYLMVVGPQSLSDNSVRECNLAFDVPGSTAVPEPASLGLLAMGLGEMLVAMRRKA